MKRLLAALTSSLLLGSAALADGSTHRKRPVKPPTRHQIHKAVAAAEKSAALWATVNICDTRHHPNTIGIRGQMPALGFPAQLEMTVRLLYWSDAKKQFVPLPHFAKLLHLGTVTYGTVQGGYQQQFTPPVILSGSVTFTWRYKRRTIGTVTRPTSHGVKGVDAADPPGHSTATCRIGG